MRIIAQHSLLFSSSSCIEFDTDMEIRELRPDQNGAIQPPLQDIDTLGEPRRQRFCGLLDYINHPLRIVCRRRRLSPFWTTCPP